MQKATCPVTRLIGSWSHHGCKIRYERSDEALGGSALLGSCHLRSDFRHFLVWTQLLRKSLRSLSTRNDEGRRFKTLRKTETHRRLPLLQPILGWCSSGQDFKDMCRDVRVFLPNVNREMGCRVQQRRAGSVKSVFVIALIRSPTNAVTGQGPQCPVLGQTGRVIGASKWVFSYKGTIW